MGRQLALFLREGRNERLREVPEHLLRTAWERSRVPQSFEAAMQLPHFRTALTRMAMAMSAKRGMKR